MGSFSVCTEPEADKTKVNFSNMEDHFPRVSKTEPETKTSVPVTELLETILNVLNRDQRTILTINRNDRRKLPSHRADESNSFSVESLLRTSDLSLRDGGCGDRVLKSSFHFLDSSGRFFNKATTRNRNRNRNRSRSSTGRRFHHDGLMSRFGEVFIVGVCLLTIIRVPVAMSAPSIHRIKTPEPIDTPESSATYGHRTGEEGLSYIHPCGTTYEMNQNSITTPGTIDEDFFKHILYVTQNALSYTSSFRDRYVFETFQLPFDEHHNQWKNHSYDWLPNDSNVIPKKLGEKWNRSYLSERSLDEFLVNIYEHLQKFAIALEQVVWDQKRWNGDFVKNFLSTETLLRNVLCGILMAMNDRNVTPKGHVLRSIMRDDIRQMETPSHRNLRDWLIFRDLMNCLEYMIEVFEFIDKLPKSSAASLSLSSSSS